MDEKSGVATGDVLPPVVNQLLGLAWILLFAGRWVLLQLLLAARVLSPTTVADLDDRVLMRVYLVLLAVTVIVAALRVMRGARLKSAAGRPLPPAKGGQTPQDASSVSLHAADRRPKPGD